MCGLTAVIPVTSCGQQLTMPLAKPLLGDTALDSCALANVGLIPKMARKSIIILNVDVIFLVIMCLSNLLCALNKFC